MPLSGDITRYPQYMLDFAMRFERGERTMEIRAPNLADAQNIRFQFYGFRRAVRRAARAGSSPFPSIDLILVRIQKGLYPEDEAIVRFSHVDDSPMKAAFEGAITTSLGPPPQPPLPADPLEAGAKPHEPMPPASYDQGAADKLIEQLYGIPDPKLPNEGE